jgi:uncharacterized membrane protein YkoI
MRAGTHCRFIWPVYRGTINEEGRSTVTRKLALIAALLVGLAGLSAGLAIAASGGPATGTTVRQGEANENESADADGSLAGADAEKASEAALAAVGGGEVLEVEAADDAGSAYEVEIRKTDGSVVEVLIDRGYRVATILAGD